MVVMTQRAGDSVRIVLNRPEALNAWNTELLLGLKDAVRSAAEDPRVRAVLITGAGRAFSAGADLKAERTEDRIRTHVNPLIASVRAMPKPVVAAVNGPAVGVGASLALACDLVLAA